MQFILQCASETSKTTRLQQHMQSNAHLHEFNKLIHACENDSATNYICHPIHLPAVRAVQLICDVTLYAQNRTHIKTIRILAMIQ